MPIRRHRALAGAPLAASLLAVALATSAVAAEGAGRKPVVVELFTSQGCSSCPPANANLARIADRPGIIALSFGVTYWDRLGWKDTYARKDYTERQIAYEGPLGESGPFTPQIVVGGRASLVGHELDAVERLVAQVSGAEDATAVTLGPASVAVGAGRAPQAGADIWLVRYDPQIVNVPIRRGENGGRTLPHKNVVHDLALLGRWTGAAQTLPVPPAAAGLRTAILVQTRGGGPILAAASD